jgi:hypothetical protein
LRDEKLLAIASGVTLVAIGIVSFEAIDNERACLAHRRTEQQQRFEVLETAVKTMSTDEKLAAYDALRTIYLDWKAILNSEKTLQSPRLRRFYTGTVTKTLRSHGTLSPAEFDVEMFPSLFSALPVIARAKLKPIDYSSLPSNWEDTAQVTKAVMGSDIARLLLAFIWKQGDFLKVKHIIAGIRDGKNCDLGNATVHRQFGKHIADPLRNPIFDQHTSRHHLVIDRIERSTSYTDFQAMFGRARALIPTSESALTETKRCVAYVEWWTRSFHAAISNCDSVEAGNVVLWSDRIMFSLGKAAELVR